MDENIEVIQVEQENIEIQEIDDAIEVDVENDIEEIELEEPDTPIDQMYEGLLGDIVLHVDANHSQYLPNQHTIGAITGLTETLNDIQSLKGSLHVKNANIANYYLWSDENPLQENRKGYFICINIDNKISICSNSNNVFGVTVDDAGFIGRQDEIARDYKYELVMNTGLVDVRCELDVVAGDYVRPNRYGRAKKDTNFGYKVVAVSDDRGDRYATISLSSLFDGLCDAEDSVNSLEDRMDSAETNIATAISVANSAHNIAQSSLDAVRLANEANDKATSALNKTEDLEDDIENAVSKSEQALTIANATSTVAVNLRNEAVAKANQALSEAQAAIAAAESLSEDLDETIESALQDAKEDIIQEIEDATNISELQQDIEAASNTAEQALTKATNNATSISSLIDWKNTTNNAISTINTNIGNNTASITALSGVINDDETGIAALSTKVDDCESTISELSDWKTENSESIANAIATTNANESSIETITAWMGDSSSGAVKAIADVTSKANANESSINSLVSWKGDANSGVTKTIADISAVASANQTSITTLTSWKNSASETITSIGQQADTNTANITALTTWKNSTDTTISSISQKANANESNINTLTSKQTATESSISSLQQNTTANQSSITALTNWRDNGYITIANWPSDPTSLNKTQVYYVTNENPHLYHYYNGTDWTTSSTPEGAGLTDSIAHIKQVSNDNSSSISSLTSIIGRDCIRADSFTNGQYTIGSTTTNANTSKVYYSKANQQYYYYADNTWKSTADPSVAGLVKSVALTQQIADTDESKIESLTEWKNNNATNVAAISSIQQKANANESSITALNTWKTSADSSIASVTSTANQNAAAISTLTTWQGTTNDAIATLQATVDPSGAMLQALTVDIDKYRVGEYSQANGLTFAQALECLTVGTVYIPTLTTSSETYSNTPNDKTTSFSKGYYYTWSNNGWVESASTTVNFSDEYVQGNATSSYWYVTSNTDITSGTETYKAHGLYHWETDKWVKVASSNSLGRSVGLLQQRSNEISLSVSNANDAVGLLQTRVANDEAETSILSSLMVNNTSISISGTVASSSALPSGQSNETYYAVGTTKPYDVYKYNGSSWNKISYLSYDGTNVKEIYAASIINSVNNDGSSIQINANKINLTGVTTFLKPSDVGSSGTTTIDGARITTGTIDTARLNASGIITAINSEGSTSISGNKIRTGTIQSNNYAESSGICTAGTKIDLSNGAITSKNFKIDSSGNATFSGNLNAAGGTFSGTLDGADGTFSGALSAATGSFSGSVTATSGNFSNVTIENSCTVAGAAITGAISIPSITINSGGISSAIEAATVNGSNGLSMSNVHLNYLYGTYVVGNSVSGSNIYLLNADDTKEVTLNSTGIKLSNTTYTWQSIINNVARFG